MYVTRIVEKYTPNYIQKKKKCTQKDILLIPP